ncbi:MAG: C45 family peptidase [Clostridiales bacterium]|nr:C45 family peptidase [Clostridiales bacterium]
MALAVYGCLDTAACTSAIVGAKRSASGATLLWKHRDTGARGNYIAHHAATDSTLEYIALHNTDDPHGLEAWIGMNREGFAVMNTASYNLVPDTASVKDREGVLMTMALEHCNTVDQFAAMLDSLPRPLGVQANFAAIDSHGGKAYFETWDNGYVRYDVGDEEAVVRTNYSHSGRCGAKLGLAREKTARRVIDGTRLISHSLLIDTLSRQYIDPVTGIRLTPRQQSLIRDKGNYIPRPISTASIVIEAIPSPGGDGSGYIMRAVTARPQSGAPCVEWTFP